LIRMNNLLMILMALSLLAVVGVLGIGLFSMVKGGEFNKKYGNKLMRWRVILQGFALAMFALAILSSQS